MVELDAIGHGVCEAAEAVASSKVCSSQIVSPILLTVFMRIKKPWTPLCTL